MCSNLEAALCNAPAFEAGRAPVNKLDGALGLDGSDGRIDVLGHNVAAVHQAARHVLAMAWVAPACAHRLSGMLSC